MARYSLLLLGLAFHASQATTTVFVTTADGPEGLAMALALVSKVRVLAGVTALDSVAARRLAAKGATLRLLTNPPSPKSFAGADWAFVLAPLSADRLQRGTALLTAARAAGVPRAALLSVIGADPAAPAPIKAYYELEQQLSTTFPGSGLVLRTYFYQQNLLLWAADARATGALRLPLASNCFAPLYESDVADALAAVMAGATVGPVLQLTGPQRMSGAELVTEANRHGRKQLGFQHVSRDAAARILEDRGGLDASEAALVLELMLLQTSPELCARWPTEDFWRATGRNATSVSVFFSQNADAFRGMEAPPEVVAPEQIRVLVY